LSHQNGRTGSTSLGEALSSPENKGRYVRRLFATIADRYDFITVALSGGLDRLWKRRVVRLARVQPRDRVLDLATGTGDIAFLLGRRSAHVVGLDLTFRMIQLAVHKRGSKRAPQFMVGDMMTLPFADGSFDVVTTGYGLRNVPELSVSLAEIHRVLADGGRLLSLDFNRPSNRIVRELYLSYLGLVGGALGWALHRDPDTYRYIPASLRHYPGAAGVVQLLKAAGFRSAASSRVLGGLMAIHHARK
jgi:demethylmenaquinone methyltransferase/2-methoxy-6-polyprenyl-1,4-benzoquinol methylase